MSLFERFSAQAEANPDNVAYVYEGHSYTWKQVHQDVFRVANYLLSLGLKPGGESMAAKKVCQVVN